MSAAPALDVSYFPGCSLATTAKENNQSLIECCRKMGINMIELSDWNCCGSSSAHSINHRLAFDLACRNLSLAPPGRTLVAACPSCTLRLKHAQHLLKNDEAARERYLQLWGGPSTRISRSGIFSACWRRWTWRACWPQTAMYGST